MVNKRNFQIVLDSESYAKAEQCGYDKAIFEGENVKGYIKLELAKPEMVKCIRIQLIGYVSKSSRINYRDVLKYINNSENSGSALQKALNPMKMFSHDSSSGSLNDDDNNVNSKPDNIIILVDYDMVLWGKFRTNDDSLSSNDHSSNRISSLFFGNKKGSKSLEEENFESRKDIINNKFVSSRLNNEPLKLPFLFKLQHISNDSSVHLPSSYNNGKFQIEYFLYATIQRPWPNRNSVRLMKLRVLQDIKVDIPKYTISLEKKNVKKLKIMKCIKKGIIEMNAKIPQKAYCHRENIPIEISINHLGMKNDIFGFVVGLYEECSYKETNTNKFTRYSFKLLSERFYKCQIKPGDSTKNIILNFPIIDGHCLIQNKSVKSNSYPSSISSAISLNSLNEEDERIEKENLKNNNEIITTYIELNEEEEQEKEEEEEEIEEEEEKEEDITKIPLKKVKIPFISATIIESSKYPIKVKHKLRIVTITDENANKIIQKMNDDDKSSTDELSDDESTNNEYEEFTEMDNEINIYITPPLSPDPVLKNNSHNNDNLNNEKSLNEYYLKNYLGGNNMQNSENQKYLNENKKYGIILGHLANGNISILPKSKKALDIDFDIVIGTMTENTRKYGKESKLDEEIEDQYYNAILRNDNIKNKLKIFKNSSGTQSNKDAQKKKEPDITIYARFKTNSSNSLLNTDGSNDSNKELTLNSNSSPSEEKDNRNKELPSPPGTNSNNRRKKITVLPQRPAPLPPRTNHSLPLSSTQSSLCTRTRPSHSLQSSSTPPLLYPGYNPSLPSSSTPPSLYPEYNPSLPSSSTTAYQTIQSEYHYQYFPNRPVYTNPQELMPSAPSLEDIEDPPPYDYNPNIFS